MSATHKQTNEFCGDYDIVSSICDIFDAFLTNEEHGTEYLIAESNNFHRRIMQLFKEEDKF